MDNEKDEYETPAISESVSADQSSHTNSSTSPEPSKVPKYQYSRDQLLAWKDVRCSRLKPSSMSRDYELSEGIWDPEKWFNSTIGDNGSFLSVNSGYTNHFNAGEKMYSRGRKPEWDMDEGGRRGTNKMLNDKGPSLKQNVGDSDVVLMPQRSFNGGCYISSNEAQHRRDGREQRFSQKVVGSGRIVDRFKGRTDDTQDGWNDRGTTSGRQRKTSEKRFESSGRSEYKIRDGKKCQPPEPSWYREGPLSRNDTIELRGFNDKLDESFVSERGKKISTKSKGEKIFEEINEEQKNRAERENKKGKNSDVLENKMIDSTDLESDGLRENAKESKNDLSPLLFKTSEGGPNAAIFDFELFAKSVSNPNKPDLEVDARESRFRQFFQSQTAQDTPTNDVVSGVALDKKVPKLPPPPPVYGHSIEKFLDPEEEKKNFMNILQKAHISFQHHSLTPSHSSTRTANDGTASYSQGPASLKDLESGIKAMLKVNASDPSQNAGNQSSSGVSQGPSYNGGNTNGVMYTSGPSKNLLFPKPLPVGSKVTRVSDLEAASTMPETFMSIESLPEKRSADPDDMSAYNKLLGMISQKAPQNQNPSNHNYHEACLVSASPSYHGQASDSSNHLGASTNVSSLLASVNNEKRQVHSPMVRSSPVAFGTCPPTNLATPMPIHAGHLINQFVANGTKAHFNNLETSLKFGTSNSIEHPPKEPVITSQGLERIHPASFLPTSVIRQMAQDKGSSKVVPQDALWSVFRSNPGEGGAPVFQPPIYNTQAPATFSPHNQLHPPHPGMSIYSRPQQPSVASFLQCLQQGRVMTQPQNPQQHQQLFHPLLQQQVNNVLPVKRAIVKGANNQALHPLPLNQDQQNLSIGNHVALQPGHVLSNAQVDHSSPAAVIAALQHALTSKRHNPGSGFEGWSSGASSVNGSSVGRTPNQVKLQ